MKEITVTKMDYMELDDLVNKTWDGWKGNFDSVAVFEWRNDHEYLIECDEPGKDVLEDAQTWASGKRPFCCGVYQLFEALYAEGVVPLGNYLVMVSW